MPSTLPGKEEVKAEFEEMRFDAFLVEEVSGQLTNDDIPSGKYGSPYDGQTIEELEPTGRIGGYRVMYNVGPSANIQRCVFVTMTINLYDDEESAEGAVHAGPSNRTGDAKERVKVGDLALAWPVSSLSYDSVHQQPGCPCDILIQVGRPVGSVSLSQRPPPDPFSVSSHAVALAKVMADRMRAAEA